MGQVNYSHSTAAQLSLDPEWTYLPAGRRTVKTGSGEVSFLTRPLVVFLFSIYSMFLKPSTLKNQKSVSVRTKL
jgi:hypothetical protein